MLFVIGSNQIYMAEHNALGKLGEEMAAKFLLDKGYDILETNWFFQKAEVDILARKQNELAVIEVKTRTGIDFGLPQDFVKPKKIRLLVKAVDAYVNDHNLDVAVRFDIIAIIKDDKGFHIKHLKNAFYYF